MHSRKTDTVYDILDLLDQETTENKICSLFVEKKDDITFLSESKQEFLEAQNFVDGNPDHVLNDQEEMFIFRNKQNTATIFNVKVHQGKKYVVDSDIVYYSYQSFCRLFFD